MVPAQVGLHLVADGMTAPCESDPVLTHRGQEGRAFMPSPRSPHSA